jgi:hypothetical protein
MQSIFRFIFFNDHCDAYFSFQNNRNKKIIAFSFVIILVDDFDNTAIVTSMVFYRFPQLDTVILNSFSVPRLIKTHTTFRL